MYFYSMSHLIAPSILAADFGNLEQDIHMINDSEADLLHVDIMDGHFVPNISFWTDARIGDEEHLQHSTGCASYDFQS